VPTRRSFALTGHSVSLDPHTHAVRKDLADVRLADRVFAPHYAAPMPRIVTASVPLRAGSNGSTDVLTTLETGEVFEVLELAGDMAWGIATAHGLVGYIPASALSGQ
jgi:hypothetical protein